MIDDSVPWRTELGKSALRLRRWDVQSRWTGRTYFLVERDIMMGAYSVRRLIDSGKTSAQLPKMRRSVRRYARTGRVPMVLDRFSPELFYDITSPTSDELTLAQLCNQFIHSFIFQLYEEESAGTSTALVFVSDRDRRKHLYGISLASLADTFDYVAREEIVETSGTMIDGVQAITNTSNHDLVEQGRAIYADDDRIEIERRDSDVSVMDARIHDIIQRRIR